MSGFEHVTLGWSAVALVVSVPVLVLSINDPHRLWPWGLFLGVMVIWVVLMVVNLRRMLRTQRERQQDDEHLAGLLDHEQWTPLADFPPSSELTPRLRALGEGYYLFAFPPDMLPLPIRKGGAVSSILWAESDYWVKRCWDPPRRPYETLAELAAPPDREHTLPSLEFMGRPARLTFRALFEYESAQPNATINPIQQTMTRNLECVFAELLGAGLDIHYYFEAFSPAPDDLPVAIMFRLRKPLRLGVGK